jgi:hypothetical protein
MSGVHFLIVAQFEKAAFPNLRKFARRCATPELWRAEVAQTSMARPLLFPSA